MGIFLFFILLINCTKYEEKTPFFDGLLLEYDLGGGIRIIYNVQSMDRNRFKIIETEKAGVLGEG